MCIQFPLKLSLPLIVYGNQWRLNSLQKNVHKLSFLRTCNPVTQ